EAKYIRLATHLCPEKYRLMQAETDFEDVIKNLETLKQIAEGNKDYGPIALLDIPERFRWLTATRSSIIQTSPVHAGKANDLDKTFDRLFQELVI
ncbi:MAG: DUF3037 domain-containing protein, partial [Proteiniphilum sp.]